MYIDDTADECSRMDMSSDDDDDFHYGYHHHAHPVASMKGKEFDDGRFVVNHIIGEGAFGVVYSAKDIGKRPHTRLREKSATEVAVKKFKKSKYQGSYTRADVDVATRREIDILKELSPHDNIIKYVHDFMQRNKMYLVMESMTCDLVSLIDDFWEDSKAPMPKHVAKHITYQCCSALVYIHSRDFVYRDLKPANVLIKFENASDNQAYARLNKRALLDRGTTVVVAKVCDFGCARKLGPNTSKDDPSPSWPHPADVMTARIGTQWYVPPECLIGTPYPDPSYPGKLVYSPYGVGIDMWGLGCLMAECLNGEILFEAYSENDQLRKIQDLLGCLTVKQRDTYTRSPYTYQNLPAPSHRPTGVRGLFGYCLNTVEVSFLKSLLSIDPSHRPSSAVAMGDDVWADLFDDET
mmetsp:Transcript_12917/g.32210  ORF Transcript_12917/g.32210 Transcript_12917/m.32210 type:complete len:409 (-) Transcript_12917:119-1345(-)|eukprot:CAMPEP_0119195118 /NCGR_PEP_ID=MMETSP1316-20130426/4942_1 /TAXON_ID=41880 /ORGANISM="Pycnococcus provasolii, Strain RCC2336" /LENGTH=408 /DNA_ID=CAMNT_0007190517 /DNA_START=215 /DNA_END=1441 /DNA_ORIENTATION=+